MDQPLITDTQVLSYYYKGTLELPKERPIRISSLTATEFLLVRSGLHEKPRYYPISLTWHQHLGKRVGWRLGNLFDSARHSARGSHRTDQLTINFGPRIPPYIEYGNLALTQIINGGLGVLYETSISHLDKGTKKILKDRLRFLSEIQVECIALTRAIVVVGLELLAQFLSKYQSKENERNTINDVFILATAIKESCRLLTGDKLLNRFAAEVVGASIKQEAERLLIDFSSPVTQRRRETLESKGYINRGWQILERRS